MGVPITSRLGHLRLSQARIRLSPTTTKTPNCRLLPSRTTFHATSPCLASLPCLHQRCRPSRSVRPRTQRDPMSLCLGNRPSRDSQSQNPMSPSAASLLCRDFQSNPAGPFPPRAASAFPGHHPPQPAQRLAATTRSADTRLPKPRTWLLHPSLLRCPHLRRLSSTRSLLAPANRPTRSAKSLHR